MIFRIPSYPSSARGANTPCNASVQSCPVQVKVVIKLSKQVACPGHPLEITAVGTPSGGTFAWTISGAELVDGSGAAVKTGPTVNLRQFKADDATGEIPEQTATVSVTYTHPNGTANDSKPVKIHKIKFEVTDTKITPGVTRASEGDDDVLLMNVGNVSTMSTKPKVKIKLDKSCPRKTDCAKNHRVGWLQTVVKIDRRIRYTHTLVTVTVPVPVRDGDNADDNPAAFPFFAGARNFTGDGDTRIAHHSDSPLQGASLSDQNPKAPAPPPEVNRQLRKVFFHTGFKAWLVVQNVEWSSHDLAGSFAFQKNFDWSVDMDMEVDMSKFDRYTPKSVPATIGAMATGKGAGTPVLTKPVANDFKVPTVTAAPGI